jgi:hypothetical protein
VVVHDAAANMKKASHMSTFDAQLYSLSTASFGIPLDECDQIKFSNLIPASEDFDIIEEISSLLDLFKTVSKVLSEDKTSTIW